MTVVMVDNTARTRATAPPSGSQSTAGSVHDTASTFSSLAAAAVAAAAGGGGKGAGAAAGGTSAAPAGGAVGGGLLGPQRGPMRSAFSAASSHTMPSIGRRADGAGTSLWQDGGASRDGTGTEESSSIRGADQQPSQHAGSHAGGVAGGTIPSSGASAAHTAESDRVRGPSWEDGAPGWGSVGGGQGADAASVGSSSITGGGGGGGGVGGGIGRNLLYNTAPASPDTHNSSNILMGGHAGLGVGIGPSMPVYSGASMPMPGTAPGVFGQFGIGIHAQPSPAFGDEHDRDDDSVPAGSSAGEGARAHHHHHLHEGSSVGRGHSHLLESPAALVPALPHAGGIGRSAGTFDSFPRSAAFDVGGMGATTGGRSGGSRMAGSVDDNGFRGGATGSAAGRQLYSHNVRRSLSASRASDRDVRQSTFGVSATYGRGYTQGATAGFRTSAASVIDEYGTDPDGSGYGDEGGYDIDHALALASSYRDTAAEAQLALETARQHVHELESQLSKAQGVIADLQHARDDAQVSSAALDTVEASFLCQRLVDPHPAFLNVCDRDVQTRVSQLNDRCAAADRATEDARAALVEHQKQAAVALRRLEKSRDESIEALERAHVDFEQQFSLYRSSMEKQLDALGRRKDAHKRASEASRAKADAYKAKLLALYEQYKELKAALAQVGVDRRGVCHEYAPPGTVARIARLGLLHSLVDVQTEHAKDVAVAARDAELAAAMRQMKDMLRDRRLASAEALSGFGVDSSRVSVAAPRIAGGGAAAASAAGGVDSSSASASDSEAGAASSGARGAVAGVARAEWGPTRAAVEAALAANVRGGLAR